MPVYEYECGACGHQFEEWQKITDGPVKTCPKCKKKKVERLISQTAFQLKGGGWYRDLYSSSSASNSKSGESEGAAKSESKSETKGETKSATKSETKSETKADKPAASTAKSKAAAKK
jgi:putative FmdB family regulatory protein